MRDFKPHSKRRDKPRIASGLVLHRKTGQSIWIGETIRITVVEVKDGNVKLCFDAPPDVVVLREELKTNTHPE